MRPRKTVLIGLRLPAGIALVMLALATGFIGVAADSSLPTSRIPTLQRSGGTEESEAPTKRYQTAYNSMSLADWLKEKGLLAEATDLYTEALNLFLKISADYPQWQPAVVAFRINYCRATLQNLQKADGEQTPDRRKMEDRGQMPEDSLKRTTDDGQRTTENQKSEIGNRKPPISNLSPLNFKLQQAALKERGRDYAGALAMYTALLEEFPQEPWAVKGACRCYLRLGRMNKARALTRQALALPLPDADLNLLAALVDCQDGRYQAAIPLLRQSLKQNGACPEAHVALGVALATTGAMQDAQEEMKRALSLNPKLGDAYYNLARLSLRQKPGGRDAARVHYQNALRHGAAPDPELDALLAE